MLDVEGLRAVSHAYNLTATVKLFYQTAVYNHIRRFYDGVACSCVRNSAGATCEGKIVFDQAFNLSLVPYFHTRSVKIGQQVFPKNQRDCSLSVSAFVPGFKNATDFPCASKNWPRLMAWDPAPMITTRSPIWGVWATSSMPITFTVSFPGSDKSDRLPPCGYDNGIGCC